MASIAFITPAYGRLPVSEIVFNQRRAACDALKKMGHEATMVVVADDENIDIAHRLGFTPLEFPNKFLGSKWNAGYRKAANLGADWMMPLGSDSLLDPALVAHWLELEPDDSRVPFTTHYAVVHKTGRYRLDCVVTSGGGGGMMFSREQLEPTGFTPVDGKLQKGCDHSTMLALARTREIRFEPHDVHSLAIVALQTAVQITSYEGLAKRWGTGQVRGKAAVGQLRRVYGNDLADQVADLYQTPWRKRG